MSYATHNDVLARYPQQRMTELTDQEAEKLQRKRISVVLEDASGEIDSYLGKAYSLPLASKPPALKRLAVDIAVYRLMSLLPKESVEDARRRYEDAIKWLEGLVAGLVELDGVAGAAGGNNNVSYVAPERVFDAAGLKGYL